MIDSKRVQFKRQIACFFDIENKEFFDLHEE